MMKFNRNGDKKILFRMAPSSKSESKLRISPAVSVSIDQNLWNLARVLEMALESIDFRVLSIIGTPLLPWDQSTKLQYNLLAFAVP